MLKPPEMVYPLPERPRIKVQSQAAQAGVIVIMKKKPVKDQLRNAIWAAQPPHLQRQAIAYRRIDLHGLL
jgi:hypothetical protein